MPVLSAAVITIPLLSAVSGSLLPTLPAKLADVVALVQADESLSSARRREILSALATLARALKRDLQDIPARIGFIREQLKSFKPSMLKPTISVGRWRNVQSLVKSAFTHVGIPTSPKPYRTVLAPAWQALLAKLDTMKRLDLSRFAQFSTAENISPEDVDDEVLARFHVHLKQTLMNKVPRDLHRKACKVWNLAAETIEVLDHDACFLQGVEDLTI